jgi:hypothetical protein
MRVKFSHSLKDFAMGEMKFPDNKIGEVAVKAQEVVKNIQKVAESVQTAAHTITEIAEKHWPKPPEHKLPPLKKKPQAPPPLPPNPKFPRQ